jgi:hypothetical protein
MASSYMACGCTGNRGKSRSLPVSLESHVMCVHVHVSNVRLPAHFFFFPVGYSVPTRPADDRPCMLRKF